MKKTLLAIILLASTICSFAALNVTGQLTNTDTVKIGDGTSYVRLSIQYSADGKSINVLTDVYKGKASYTNGKSVLPPVTQINRVYVIDSATIATAPTSGFAGLSGTSLLDKMLYWVHQKVLSYIVADNPTFTGTIVDLK